LPLAHFNVVLENRQPIVHSDPGVCLNPVTQDNGVRIPKAIIDQLELEPDVQLEVRGEGGPILLIPVSTKPTLTELFEKVTPENLHGEVNMEPSVGDDAWG